MDYRYLEEPWDLERLREAMWPLHGPKNAPYVEELLAPAAGDVESDEALDVWLPRNVGTSCHISGTCKTGPDSDPMAVVDPRLRVRGVAGLWVADASVMPYVVRANTNITTIMIAERKAARIPEGN